MATQTPICPQVFNLGCVGESSAEALVRFDESVLPLNPDVLILYYGMNDSLFTCKMCLPAEYRKRLTALLLRAKACGIPHILPVTLHRIDESIVRLRKGDHPGRADLNGWLSQYDAIVRDISKSLGLKLFDLRKTIDDHGGPEGQLVRNHSNGGDDDGLHLTPLGYQRMAKGIFDAIRPWLTSHSKIVCLGDSLTFGAHVLGGGTVRGETYPAYLQQLVSEVTP